MFVAIQNPRRTAKNFKGTLTLTGKETQIRQGGAAADHSKEGGIPAYLENGLSEVPSGKGKRGRADHDSC